MRVKAGPILAVSCALFLIGAAGGHVARLHHIPYAESDRVIEQIMAVTAGTSNPMQVNQLRHSGLRYAGPGDLVVRDNPDTLTSFAPYDLAAGDLCFTAPVPEQAIYWSVSVYARNTDNVFVLDNHATGDDQVSVLISRAARRTQAPARHTAVSPSTRGVIIVRLVVPDRHNDEQVRALSRSLEAARLDPADAPRSRCAR